MIQLHHVDKFHYAKTSTYQTTNNRSDYFLAGYSDQNIRQEIIPVLLCANLRSAIFWRI